MAELTEKGYLLKTQNEYFAQERDLYLGIDPNWNLDPSTPDGLKLASDAELYGNFDEQLQRSYNSKDPNKASGYDLDVVCALTGTERSLGTPSSVELTLSGTVGAVVIAGSVVESPLSGSRWKTDANATIGEGGTVTVTATCLTNGATQASIGTITRIISTVGGWQSVTNNSVATPGTDVQSDSLLRAERQKAVGRPGSNQVDNMLGEIFSVAGVRRAVIYENDTGSVDANELPAHSIAPIVDGGSNEDVARAIFRKKNPGCALHSAGTTVTVPDVYDQYPSNKKTITFSRPNYVDMNVTVTVQNGGNLPNDTEQRIKDAIITYTTGELIPPEYGFNGLGFDIGEDVPVSRMATPVNQVIGQYAGSYIVGLTVNSLTFGQDVAIAFNELSRWSESNILVAIND